MRLEVAIRDREYRMALVKLLEDYDRDIFVEISDSTIKGKDSVILTDISPEDFSENELERISCRSVFLITEPCERELHTVFKYAGFDEIISETSIVYNELTGNLGLRGVRSKLMSVCSSNDGYSHELCKMVARQIIYNFGGQLLIIPLGYINDYGINDKSDCRNENVFRRLLYLISANRYLPIESYTRVDSYGISYFNIDWKLNPIAFLEGEELKLLIRAMSNSFDTIILDIGTAYRKENIDIIRSSDKILFFSSSRLWNIADVIGEESLINVNSIEFDGISDESIQIDEYIRSVFQERKHEP